MKGTAGSVTCGSPRSHRMGCVIVCHMCVFGCGQSCQGKTTFYIMFKFRNNSCVKKIYLRFMKFIYDLNDLE